MVEGVEEEQAMASGGVLNSTYRLIKSMNLRAFVFSVTADI